VVRTPLIRDEEQSSESGVQVMSDGSLQLSDVASRDLASFTCIVPLQDDDRLALAETFTITLQGPSFSAGCCWSTTLYMCLLT